MADITRLRRLLIALANTVALPGYLIWFGLHESRDLFGEIAYGWRRVWRV